MIIQLLIFGQELLHFLILSWALLIKKKSWALTICLLSWHVIYLINMQSWVCGLCSPSNCIDLVIVAGVIFLYGVCLVAFGCLFLNFWISFTLSIKLIILKTKEFQIYVPDLMSCFLSWSQAKERNIGEKKI